MNTLFITQKVDRQDAVLGFVHRWLEKLAVRCEKLTVICLEQGTYRLPANVRVLSLGKENKLSRLRYAVLFYAHLWQLRKQYDTVVVHMNPVYVLMGFLFWRLERKKIFMWYNHEYGNLLAKTAVRLVRTVFYTSPFSFASRYSNGTRMPAGIDTGLFAPGDEGQRAPSCLLYVGRIAPIKKVHVLLDAVCILHRRGTDIVLQLAGGPGKDDGRYYHSIREKAAPLEQAGVVRFLGNVPNRRTAELYRSSTMLFNLSPPGLYDKTVLEAMACGCPVLVCSPAFRDALPDMCFFEDGNPADLASKIEGILGLSDETRWAYTEKFRSYVVGSHSLDLLVRRLFSELEH